MSDTPSTCVHVPPTSSMQQCIDTYGIEGKGEWVNNSVSSLTQFWSCGVVSRTPSSPPHDHDPLELARCQALAKQAAAMMGPVWPICSGADPETQPFFIAAQRKKAVPKRLTEKLIRAALGGALHPDARVVIESFAEGTKWWREVAEGAQRIVAEDPGHTKFDDLVRQCRDLMRWFPANSLVTPSFVRTTDSRKASLTLGCVFPCFILGISDMGSLIGVATHVVE